MSTEDLLKLTLERPGDLAKNAIAIFAINYVLTRVATSTSLCDFDATRVTGTFVTYLLAVVDHAIKKASTDIVTKRRGSTSSILTGFSAGTSPNREIK